MIFVLSEQWTYMQSTRTPGTEHSKENWDLKSKKKENCKV